MKQFCREARVLVCEFEQLQHLAETELGWSYQQWQRRWNGTQPLDNTERIALKTLLNEKIRKGAKVVYLLPNQKVINMKK